MHARKQAKASIHIEAWGGAAYMWRDSSSPKLRLVALSNQSATTSLTDWKTSKSAKRSDRKRHWGTSSHVRMYVYRCVYIYIPMYIKRKRKRERERDRENGIEIEIEIDRERERGERERETERERERERGERGRERERLYVLWR